MTLESGLDLQFVAEEWLTKFYQYDETFAYHMMMLQDARKKDSVEKARS